VVEGTRQGKGVETNMPLTDSLVRKILEGMFSLDKHNPLFFTKLPSDFWLSLHYRDPLLTKRFSEISYPGYKRISVGRSSNEWHVCDNRVFNRKEISFPPLSMSRTKITHIAASSDPLSKDIKNIIFTVQITSSPTSYEFPLGYIPTIRPLDLSFQIG
jgi:hypothetical protein